MVVEDDLDSLPHSDSPLRGSFASRFLAAAFVEPLSARRSRSGSQAQNGGEYSTAELADLFGVTRSTVTGR